MEEEERNTAKSGGRREKSRRPSEDHLDESRRSSSSDDGNQGDQLTAEGANGRRHRWMRRRRAPGTALLLLLLFLSLTIFVPSPATAAIGCFVCASVNGSNAACEDTFNSTIYASVYGNVGLYQQPCWAFRKNRKGLFPADHCVKISGHQSGNVNHTVLIRTCALDSGSLTADTEIVRISHCGFFKYEGHHYNGCVLSCDTDGCNFSWSSSTSNPILLCFSSLIIFLLLRLFIQWK